MSIKQQITHALDSLVKHTQITIQRTFFECFCQQGTMGRIITQTLNPMGKCTVHLGTDPFKIHDPSLFRINTHSLEVIPKGCIILQTLLPDVSEIFPKVILNEIRTFFIIAIWIVVEGEYRGIDLLKILGYILSIGIILPVIFAFLPIINTITRKQRGKREATRIVFFE